MHSDLLQLSEAEKSNNYHKKSSFYQFLSEQKIMTNTSHYKRIYLENLHTILYTLQIKSKSTHYYELLKKNIPFILLPDKIVFIEYN